MDWVEVSSLSWLWFLKVFHVVTRVPTMAVSLQQYHLVLDPIQDHAFGRMTFLPQNTFARTLGEREQKVIEDFSKDQSK